NMMKKKKGRLVPAVFAAVLSVALLFSGCGKSDKGIRMGTAGEGGNYYSFGQAFGKFLEDDIEGLDVDVRVTAGSAANIRLMTDKGKYIELAIAQADVINDYLASNSQPGFGAIAGLYTEACQVVTLADSGITSVRDLRGRAVSVGEEESGSEKNAKQILQAYGISMDMVDAKNMNYTEAADALNKGEIDAFFCTVGVQTTTVEQLAKKTPIRLLDITGTEAEALTDTYPYFVSYTIPAGTYTGQAQDVQTLGVKSILIASSSLSADRVKQITGCLFDHVQDLEYVVPVDFELDPVLATKDIPVPFHDGAKAWYSDNGIAID
ncbi:MAG: TAXI family TRAP transporter solute-binding subunit, partial [Eubacteriales bacterium]|nr:TAXI family TRAP transporter solute-binding subunit [Eubacteriales bacterium]